MRLTTAEYIAIQARLNPRTDAPAGEGCEDESKLHDQIIAECKRRGLYFVHSRMDRATTTAMGVPDFIIAAPDGRTFWIEAKTRTGKLKPEQQGALHWLTRLGHQAAVVRSIEELSVIIRDSAL